MKLIDRFGRHIHYLRISIIDKCNLRCIYCTPSNDHTVMSKDMVIEIIKTAVKLGINKIRITGGEPLLHPQICEIVKEIGQIKEIKDFCLTTNGILLKHYAKILKELGLKRVNIGISTLDKNKYIKITKIDALPLVLEGIYTAIEAGLNPVKLNTVITPGLNEDEIESFKKFAQKLNIDLQFIRKMELFIPKSNFDIDGKDTFSRPPPCEECNRIRITADVKAKPCLFSNLEFDIKKVGIEQAIKLAIQNKPEKGTTCTNKKMNQIGG